MSKEKNSSLIEIRDILKEEMDKFNAINDEIIDNQHDFQKINDNYNKYNNLFIIYKSLVKLRLEFVLFIIELLSKLATIPFLLGINNIIIFFKILKTKKIILCIGNRFSNTIKTQKKKK